MKTKKIMRSISLVLVLCIILSATVFASSTRASEYLSAYYATISKTSDGNISIYFNVIAPAKMDHLGASKISVQRYTGSYWRTEYRTVGVVSNASTSVINFGSDSKRAPVSICEQYGAVKPHFSANTSCV